MFRSLLRPSSGYHTRIPTVYKQLHNMSSLNLPMLFLRLKVMCMYFVVRWLNLHIIVEPDSSVSSK